jgi:16S rRNA (guanine966-N2)-methyltransferase
MMRIVGGTLSGRTLTAPRGRQTRPTADRVREAIFNKLEHGVPGFALAGIRVLDLFAGSGAMGLEALSRGANHVLFIDDDEEARGLIRRNADALGVIGRTKIWRRDATRLGRSAPLAPFALALLDPPYRRGLATAALGSLVAGGWLAPQAVVVVEEAAGETIEAPPALSLTERRDYGETQVGFYFQSGQSVM